MTRRAEKPNRIRSRLILLLLGLIFITGIMAFSRTSYFDIDNIIVDGNVFVNKDEVISCAQIETGMNYFSVRPKDVKERLKSHPYILEGDIKREMPDRVIISVKERSLVGYIPFMGSFLLIDDEGRVISAAASRPVEELPVFKGVEIENFQAQEILEVDNEKIFDKIVYISNSIVENIIEYDSIEVNIEDIDNITIELDGRFVVKLGDVHNLDYKLKYSDTILEKLYPQDFGGEIDVSCGERAFFRPW